MPARAVIFGCAEKKLLDVERAFFRQADPWGFIVFARNIENPDQIHRLASEMREAVGRDAPILIDQEGGRVARMRAPAWREWAPALEECSRLPDVEMRVHAMGLRYRLIAGELRSVGIDVNCAPVLDVVSEHTHPVLKNRCYGQNPEDVARIGRAVADALIAGGVVPVMKHIPGQGRAKLDSHAELPEIEASTADLAADFAPFRSLSDLPIAMTGHVVFSALDPSHPATSSPTVIDFVRRDLDFDGLLLTDDLSMRALTGSFAGRVTGAMNAGCDVVLHCNGDAHEMDEVADAAPLLSQAGAARADKALAYRQSGASPDAAALEAELKTLQERAAHA